MRRSSSSFGTLGCDRFGGSVEAGERLVQDPGAFGGDVVTAAGNDQQPRVAELALQPQA